ncbi:MAG: hypothetical protein V1831_01385 [Candidatus Woesearchaeota archaeon]
MKIIGIEIKTIEIGRFFPKENQVELDISFNDGSDKEIFKVVDASEPERAAEDILSDLRKMEKNINKISENRETITDNFMNIVIKNEEELIKEMSKFIQKAKSKMDKIQDKHVAEGYLDLIRELKNLKADFTQLSQ